MTKAGRPKRAAADRACAAAFALNLAAAMRRSGMSKDALATAIGMKTRRSVNVWLSGETAPQARYLVAISRALDVEIAQLLG